MTDQAPTLTQVVVEMIGTAIKFPQQLSATSFLPNAISINNRSASTIQVGPGAGGPFILAGQFTLATLPWTYGRSIWVQEVGGPAAHINTEFVQISFLGVSPASAVGAGSITSYAPAGWGPVGPGSTLADIHAGDPFNYGQVQQILNYLQNAGVTGTMAINGQIFSIGPQAGLGAFDRDGIGGDFWAIIANNGSLLFQDSNNLNIVLQISEVGTLTNAGTIASTGSSAALFLQDRDQVGGDLWEVIANLGNLLFFSSVAGSSPLQLGEGPGIGFFGTAPQAKPAVTGSRAGNAALASLLTGLAGLGLLTDSTTP